MSSVSEVADAARQYLRDFPSFFQISTEANGRTFKLSHPNVIASKLYVGLLGPSPATTPTELVAGTNYDLDARNGILRLAATPAAGSTLMIEGYYYEWVGEDDMTFAAKVAINELTTPGQPHFENLSDIVVDALALGTVAQAMWALLVEFARDIDVSTPEAVHVPARQRFEQWWRIVQEFTARYNQKAAMLNIGLNRIEVTQMRRVSLTTGRYVPLYRNKEIGDTEPIERLWPAIPTGGNPSDEEVDSLRDVRYVQEIPPTTGVAWGNEPVIGP